ncbi:MSCRAMM family protein [Extibacter muris]|uniref:MSCRAMM family protein n=1 Tax=Extibacter muris TaxID=1796622 RepID=UPI001D08B0B2|nr:SpaA isopeptide-forming pilin-related protein [Extibacter muris]MCB6202664.1 hypothetical protein [Extibacter muris]MCQ4663901.1 SpaA isopeptide-forming pilin-related protein [Extibacter muris]MCQ4693467.1 SpaA isopeptide-forming pilin-related protein [Extibacter muris]
MGKLDTAESYFLDVSGSRETVSAYFKLHTEKIGHIKLKKTAVDGNVGELRLHITGNGIDRIYTTDKYGNIPIKNLVAGEYVISEVDTPNKYVQPQTQVVYVKPAETTAVDFNNILKKFNINITKSDEETGSTPQVDATLDGAEYDIYDSQGNLVDHMKADGQTATSKLLVLGTYKIYETVPPTDYTNAITPLLLYGIYHMEETTGAEGYRKIEPFDIKIDSNGKIYKYILENTVYETDVKIVKKDAETGKVIPLAGTQFKIKYSARNWVTQSYKYPKPTTIDTILEDITTQDGTIRYKKVKSSIL